MSEKKNAADFTSTDTIARADANAPEDDNQGNRLISKKDARRNLIMITVLMSTLMIGERIFGDVFQLWTYTRFEKQVLGANYSQLNVSAVKNPCLNDDSQHENPFKKELNEAQKLSSNFNTYRELFSSVPAALTCLMFGAYSDYVGRKLFLIIPISGIVVRTIITLAVCVGEYDLYYLFAGFISEGFTGTHQTLLFALYAYTADNTNEKKSRSFEMVLVTSVTFSLSSLSSLASGYAVATIGYTWPFAAAAVIEIFTLIGIIFLLKETLPKRKVPCITPVRAVKEIFGFYFVKNDSGEFKRRDFILILSTFIFWAMAHSLHIRRLFLLNEPFCWNSKDIGKADTATGILHGFYSLIAVKLLKKCVSDEVMVIMFMVCSLASDVVYAFASTNWHIYIALGAALLEGNVWSILRAVLSQMGVPHTRRGSLFASIAVLEVAIMHSSTAATSALYANTVKIWRGITFIVVSAFLVLDLSLMTTYIIKRKKNTNSEKTYEVAYVAGEQTGDVQAVSVIETKVK